MATAPPTLEGHDHARRPRPGLVEGRTALVIAVNLSGAFFMARPRPGT